VADPLHKAAALIAGEIAAAMGKRPRRKRAALHAEAGRRKVTRPPRVFASAALR
jgi:hypothetical protein